MVNFGPLAADIGLPVWGTPANFNGFRILEALLHGTLVVGVSQTLRRWTEGATYIWQGGHHIGHWPTFLVYLFFCSWHRTWSSTQTISFVVCLVAIEVINAWRKIVVYFHIWHVAKVPRHLNSLPPSWWDGELIFVERSRWKCRVVVFFVVIGGFNSFCSCAICRCMKWNRFCIHLYSTRHHCLTVHSP